MDEGKTRTDVKSFYSLHISSVFLGFFHFLNILRIYFSFIHIYNNQSIIADLIWCNSHGHDLCYYSDAEYQASSTSAPKYAKGAGNKASIKKSGKQHNTLPLWGNEATMNLNPLILANIQSSSYFKGTSMDRYSNVFYYMKYEWYGHIVSEKTH